MASSDDKVRVNMTSGGRSVPLQPAVRLVLEQIRAGTLPEPNRRALLDAFGHTDSCVHPEHYCHIWQQEREARERAETALRPFADLGKHCVRFGITETALVNVSLLDRAHDALNGDSDG